MQIRTRFAPSPTGFLHIGGLRTALYNYLFARRNGGRFILRIEDTDQQRKVRGAVENLLEVLTWAGIPPDEGPNIGGDRGPYIQSKRLTIYKKWVQILLEKGHAYACFCRPERLAKLRQRQLANQEHPRYDNRCRRLDAAEARRRVASGESHVIRMKVPLEGEIIVWDQIRGKVTFDCSLLDDQILQKSDGFPTYHLANVVDDHLMAISHVIRGEEWLSSTPKHHLLYEYFGWQQPKLAHVPLLLNPDKSKLSKRQGDVAVEEYRRKGFLPEALLNFLALLGWNPGSDRELFSLTELVAKFSVKRIGKSGAILNPEKLAWMNGHYIRELHPERYYQLAKPFLPNEKRWSAEQIQGILDTVRNYLSTLGDIPDKAAIFYPPDYSNVDSETREFIVSADSITILKSLRHQISQQTAFDAGTFYDYIRAVQQTTGLRGRPLWSTVRAAITGQAHGPDINKVAEILGRDECLDRINKALDYAAKNH